MIYGSLYCAVSVEQLKDTSDNDSPHCSVQVLIFRIASECILSRHLFLRISCYDVTIGCL